MVPLRVFGNMYLIRILMIAVIAGAPIWSHSVCAHPATGIVVDRTGNVYFSDLETIWKLDQLGHVSIFRPGVRGRHIHELTIDSEGNIYGGDYSYQGQNAVSEIWKMTPSGISSSLLAPTTDPPRGMSIWLDHAGNMYLIEQNNHTRSRTILLRRSPDGQVTTMAGGAFGHQDGKGTSAKFGSIGGLAFGPDGSLYMTDGTSVRKVTTDGTVTTVANNLAARAPDDKPTLFGGPEPIMTGLAVNSAGTIYVADAGNRRLLRIGNDGKPTVVLREVPPYFPNGVTTAADGTVYVLEFSFIPPGTWGGARVRKVAPDGTSSFFATAGTGPADSASSTGQRQAVATNLSTATTAPRLNYVLAIFGLLLFSGLTMIWLRRKRRT
ncbi:MAG TPA: hypothetical protein VJT50_12985 [Pyrinomonadaceae bacterium]|nr:hypothetical protein [Pyrinomonadaceae bacterium]